MAIEFVAQELPFTVEAFCTKARAVVEQVRGTSFNGNGDEHCSRCLSWVLVGTGSGRLVRNVRYWFQALQSSGDRGDAGRVASWMDLLAREVVVAGDAVASVVNRFSSGEVSAPRFANDVYQRYETLQELLRQIRLYGTSLCQQWGFEVPENLAQASTSPTVQQ